MKAVLYDARQRYRGILLKRLPVLLGRSAEAGIRILDSSVSRRHCEFSEKEGRLFVRDLGSKNGFRVNGRDAVECWLMPGDTLSLGTTTYVVKYEAPDECHAADELGAGEQ